MPPRCIAQTADILPHMRQGWRIGCARNDVGPLLNIYSLICVIERVTTLLVQAYGKPEAPNRAMELIERPTGAVARIGTACRHAAAGPEALRARPLIKSQVFDSMHQA
jgi:hypothetical protein